jgi:DNA repair photolyase
MWRWWRRKGQGEREGQRKGEGQGKVTDYYASPRWSGEFLDCSVPMTFDQYSMCGYRCVYCFSIYQKGIGVAKKNYLERNIRSVDVKKVKGIFKGQKGQFGPFVKEKMVVQWGGLADPFCPLEKERGVGLELMRFFAEIDYPLTFSTKGTWWTKDKRYTEIVKGRKNWNCKFSLVTMDKGTAEILECGAPSPRERIGAIERYVKLGAGGATLRFRPFIIGVSERTARGLIRAAAGSGADAISMEFFCMEGRSDIMKKNLARIAPEIGVDIGHMYSRYSRTTGYMRLNRSIKKRYVDLVKEEAERAGMRLYISDAHFKELCPNGSCCGLPASWNYSRGQYTQALLIARKKGEVRWSDIEGGLAWAKAIKYGSAEGYNTGTTESRARFSRMTMYDYAWYYWNNVNSYKGPYRYFEGVLKPKGYDEQGNVIYVYDGE